jgi:hypothetical protein
MTRDGVHCSGASLPSRFPSPSSDEGGSASRGRAPGNPRAMFPPRLLGQRCWEARGRRRRPPLSPGLLASAFCRGGGTGSPTEKSSRVWGFGSGIRPQREEVQAMAFAIVCSCHVPSSLLSAPLSFPLPVAAIPLSTRKEGAPSRGVGWARASISTAVLRSLCRACFCHVKVDVGGLFRPLPVPEETRSSGRSWLHVQPHLIGCSSF